MLNSGGFFYLGGIFDGLYKAAIKIYGVPRRLDGKPDLEKLSRNA
jgi:hypothetical protein